MAHAKPYAKAHNTSDDIKFGVFGGPTISRFIYYGGNTKSDDRQFRLRFHAQAFGAYQLNEYLDAALTIGYHAKGMKVASKRKDRYEQRASFDYLQTNAQLNIFPGQDRQFFFVAGGYVGYLLTAKYHEDTYVNDQKEGDTRTTDIKDTDNELNKWDLGVVLGWGYEFEMGLILKAVSEIGIRKNFDIDVEGLSVARNFAGNISLGYNFGKLLK
jgi:hypothetical protein